jgi:hypothetical protein
MNIERLLTYRTRMDEALSNGVYYRITERGIFKYSCPRRECEFETTYLKQARGHMFNTHPVIER